jgi:hypothetical protein
MSTSAIPAKLETIDLVSVNHEAETYSLFRRVCPDCQTFRRVKDYTMRRIRTVFGIVEVRNPRWMLCRDCHPTIAPQISSRGCGQRIGAFAKDCEVSSIPEDTTSLPARHLVDYAETLQVGECRIDGRR